MEIASKVVTITTAGAAGSATGSEDSDMISGYIENIYIDYDAAAPATTDVTIAFKSGGNILVVSNNATDGRYYPLVNAHDAAGAAISGVYEPAAINEPVTVSVAGCDALTDAVEVTITYLKI